MLSFKGLYIQALRYYDEAENTSTTLQVVKDALNAAHAARVSEAPWPFMMWPREETLTTVVSANQYSLHEQYGRPLWVWNATTNQPVYEVPLRTLAGGEFNIRPNAQMGSARSFIYSGYSVVANQPSAASVVTLVSDDAADTGDGLEVVIKGVDTNGFVRAERITPDGITPVNGVVTWDLILGVTKEQAWTGTLTLTTNSGAVTNVVLDADQFGKGYRQIYLLQTPSAAETISYRFYRKPLQLVNDFDIPDIPYPYSQVLVFDALLLMATYNPDVRPEDKALWMKEQAKWEMALWAAFGDQQNLHSVSAGIHDHDSGMSYSLMAPGGIF